MWIGKLGNFPFSPWFWRQLKPTSFLAGEFPWKFHIFHTWRPRPPPITALFPSAAFAFIIITLPLSHPTLCVFLLLLLLLLLLSNFCFVSLVFLYRLLINYIIWKMLWVMFCQMEIWLRISLRTNAPQLQWKFTHFLPNENCYTFTLSLKNLHSIANFHGNSRENFSPVFLENYEHFTFPQSVWFVRKITVNHKEANHTALIIIRPPFLLSLRHCLLLPFPVICFCCCFLHSCGRKLD